MSFEKQLFNPTTGTTSANDASGPNAVENRKHDPQIVKTFFEGLTKIVVAISTLGSGFTFSFILNGVHPPSNSYFEASTVHLFLAISWFLFILALTLSSLATLLLNFWGDDVVKQWNQHRGWPVTGCLMGILLVSTIITPFMFVSLVIMAYQKPVGIAALCLVGCVYTGSLVASILRLRIDLDDTKIIRQRLRQMTV
jgi:hypothetical protein